ncbi:uncharacterized protein LOC131605396 [Vicia villosa]|uniref:uncharacterized protein LOC131605396 n=1 Tax=Vicia villosa TaxID=3911 RepID=UPI00273C9FDE|nr:uncharacterized protein LOC131605396 [Vicia villosa]
MSFITYILFILSLTVSSSIAGDFKSSITESLFISDGETIVSPNGLFELAFFSLKNPNKRYLGIQFKNIPTQNVVWVANGGQPINHSSAVLTLNSSGCLVLTHNNNVVWSTNTSTKPLKPVAQLLDTGNLVIKDIVDETYLWQSFDYPSNTLLAGMKLGWDLKRNLNRRLIAWKSDDDPTPGDFTWGVVLNNYPEIYMMKGETKYHRLGPWNGLRFSGMPEMRPNPVFSYNFVYNKEEVYYSWNSSGSSLISKVVLNQTSNERPRYTWSKSDKSWMLHSNMPGDYCDRYGLCGNNGYCNITNSPVCDCLQGFKPKFLEKWNSMDWSQGCVRNPPLNCTSDGFISMTGLKVPDTTNTSVDKSIGLEQCRHKCLKNCSCVAYRNINISGAGSGCVMWFGELIDIKLFPLGDQVLYIRMPASELGKNNTEVEHRRNLRKKVVISVSAALGMFLIVIYFSYRFRRSIVGKSTTEGDYERHMDDQDLPLLNLSTIIIATDNFSKKNKIGEGGFGPVYMGKLGSGLEIAVKRLSQSSKQGMREFINEVKLIANVQHRNLVKLIGCCIQKHEKLLVYEYMANGSLDYLIFDRTKSQLLDWPKRFNIICGIARGLMYLHQDSRLRIVHRDLKASNVLLDDTMNPKISDFGMARTFGGNQIEGNTNRIVGTYGYMAPEYAIDGQFSSKSDVFSFGVLILEIICGKKNRVLNRAKQTLNLVAYAWTFWKHGKASQLIDSNIEDLCIVSEVSRCIHIGLLCVQQYPEDRPTMADVILMLGSEMALDDPKEPSFITRKESTEANSNSSGKDISSNYEMTITTLSVRWNEEQIVVFKNFLILNLRLRHTSKIQSSITKYQCHAMEILSFITMMIAYMIVPIIATNSISVSESLSDGETLVSKDGQFELGFFRPGNSTRRYLGIWYKQVPKTKVVWVANRANGINNTLGILTLSTTGNLILQQNETSVWSTPSEKQAQKPIAELLDNGNLVIRNQGETDPEGGTYLWQSFDYPCDTILPGMKLGWDLKNDFEWRVTSWKSPDDPSPGDLSWSLVLHNYPEFYLMNGTEKYSRIGPWNGLQISGLHGLTQTSVFDFKYVANNDLNYVSNKDEMFYSFTRKNSSVIVNVALQLRAFIISVWSDHKKLWVIYSETPLDQCDIYGTCGANSMCSIDKSPFCECLLGFVPKSMQQWALLDRSQGCVRNISLSCNNPQMDKDVDDEFIKYRGVVVPDTTHTLLDENIDLELCRTMCLNNCTCTAYTNSDISGKGSGCVMWFGDLIDIRQFDTGGQDLYIRIAHKVTKASNGHNKSVITIATTIAAAISGMLLFCIYVIYKVRKRIADKSKTEDNIEKHLQDMDLPLFDLQTIVIATSNFSLNNKIGQGGFGSVYKGKLADGQEIAVKRLSTNSGQGITEFLTEVKLIAKLQHRNLVKLLGCCVGGQEKLLVYEYMANGSLDSFIFDKIKGKLLEWPERFQIIFGIARGLVYLHQDSRLRIIHRDLKASNVLLDDKLNPKISDFGMARSFGGDQIEGNTNRVVGTYGYMAPEYAADGQFSIKSDVFSFGVLLLEIICGNKNRALYHENKTLNLVGYAWTLWKERKSLELIELRIKESCVVSEVLRCIHVSLLCVQQYPEDRPTMTSIVQMLGSEMELEEPREPGFFPRKVSDEGIQNEMSLNEELTITSLNGR